MKNFPSLFEEEKVHKEFFKEPFEQLSTTRFEAMTHGVWMKLL